MRGISETKQHIEVIHLSIPMLISFVTNASDSKTRNRKSLHVM
jgi:hypothetical protein